MQAAAPAGTSRRDPDSLADVFSTNHFSLWHDNYAA
jgi:hypothetical protein